MDYKSAGVDIEKGEALVDWLKKPSQTPAPHAGAVIDGIGGFASVFQPNLQGMSEPCFVSATDGVGTKLKLAIAMGQYEGLGQDLVAMCANDLICTGAQPLFFLDYFATSELELSQAQTFLHGVREACHQAQMVLIGGETAEMPGLYQKGDFDCAGFAVGVVDKAKILGPHKVEAGMQALGVASQGFHSNGFSLLRKLFSSPEDLKTWGAELLTPTQLYVKLSHDLLAQFPEGVKAMAHITGGGVDNIPRALPKGLGLRMQVWTWPEVFHEAARRSELSPREMLRTFNCGVGLVLIVEAKLCEKIKDVIQSQQMQVYDLGAIVSSEESLIWPEEWRA